MGQVGESREKGTGMWEQLVIQDTAVAAGCPAPGWERLTTLRAGSALGGCGMWAAQGAAGAGAEGGMECGSCLGPNGGKVGMETITGGRVWLQPVQP